MPQQKADLTHLLQQIKDGDDRAKELLLQAVYDELRRLARKAMSSERDGHTLQPTALVHEAFLQLMGGTRVDWTDSHHFFIVASRTMRRILIDHARQLGAKKRSGGQRVDLDEQHLLMAPQKAESYLQLEEALNRLEQISPRSAQIVELKFFGGLTFDEIAKVLDIHSRTVKRDWEKARTWLHAAMSEPGKFE
jgi:RNA polymerase sigma-70 factor, ECF subfamily